MQHAALLASAIAAAEGYLELGNNVTREHGATFVTNGEWPGVNDANHCSLIRFAHGVDDEAATAAVTTRAGESYENPIYKVDPLTPAAFEAALVLSGLEWHTELHMLLTGDVAVRPASPASIRPVSSEEDWVSLAALKRADDLDMAATAGKPPRSEENSEALFRCKRAKFPDLVYFLASVDGIDCAFFSSWPGTEGVGIVEDLFTLPDYRRKGIASHLIGHAVADARGRGAGPVGISAAVDDTPKHLFAALGFRPFFLVRSYSSPD